MYYSFYSMSEITIKRVIQPWLSIELLFKLTKFGRRHDQCIKILHGFTNKVIAERKALMMGQTNASGTASSDEDIGRSCQ